MKTIWICHFEFKGTARKTASEDGIRAFSEGFWINKEREFTKLSDGKYWIPPHKIEYIEEVNRNQKQ